MSSVIDKVKECASRFVQVYFEKKKNLLKNKEDAGIRHSFINVIPYDGYSKMCSSDDLAYVLQLIGQIKAGGGTNFANPLNDITNYITTNDIQNL
jgi:hypothetical protein